MKIAHLTDLHLRRAIPGDTDQPQRRSREMPDLLPRALERIADGKPDLLAITGDLADVPLPWLPTALAPAAPTTSAPSGARDNVLGDYRLIRDLLDASGMAYLVLPGNHDWPELMWQVFDDTPAELSVAGHRVVQFFDREHEANVPRRVGDDRARFDACLIDDDATPQVHLQHFVVTPQLNAGYPHSYADGHLLARQTLDSGRVRLSLAGHYHAGTPLIRIGDTTFTTAPAFGELPHPWRVYELDGRGVTMQTHELATRGRG
ncbi:MAG: metallophosphoesterase [Phycisphaeraceae bacterium]